jgi:hypothetical protein
MDTFISPLNDDEKAELARLEAALEEDRLDPRPSISNEVMQAKLLKKLAELKLKMAAHPAE